MSSATVLIVDDLPHKEADQIAEDVAETGEVAADAVHPGKLTQAEIEAADLILVDYKLEAWLEVRDAEEEEKPADRRLVAQRPCNGLALASVIRSQLPKDDGVRGIALLSANLTDLVQDFARAATEHAAARFSGVEWAFDKEEIDELPDLAIRIRSFAAALRSLNEKWPQVEEETDREQALFQLLELGDAPWKEVAGRDVHAAQAPINQYGTASHGLSVLRWLGQRVLPYPTFLLDFRRLALACGIAPEAIDDDDERKALESVFADARYRGPLAEFLGPRWWGAGVRYTVKELVDDPLPEPVEIADAVEARAGMVLKRLQPSGAVLGIDGGLNVVGTVAREGAFRIRPDDWPPFAESGWLPKEQLAEDRSLIDLIDPVDRERAGS